MLESKQEHRKHLIEKIKEINDEKIIDEIYRLLEIDFEDTVYVTNRDQQHAVAEARRQIRNGQTIPEEEADKEIDQWLEG